MPGSSGQPAPGSRLRAVLVSRITWAAVAATLVVVLGGLGWVWWTLSGTASDSCEEWAEVDLSIREIVALKDRRRRYQRAYSESAYFEMSGREASFLLKGETEYGVWLEAVGDRLMAHVTAPAEDHCYNIDFVGRIEVHDGAPRLEPESLEVGHTDLTWWLSLRQHWLGLPAIKSEAVRTRLAKVQHLEVRDDLIRVRFVDAESVW